MKKLFLIFMLGLGAFSLSAQEFNQVPRAWKWVSPQEVAFTYDGTYEDDGAFSIKRVSLMMVLT